jgi:predicted nucleic acid-binding protein
MAKRQNGEHHFNHSRPGWKASREKIEKIRSCIENWKKGISRADDSARERAKVAAFMPHAGILTPDGATAEESAELQAKGERIPENDTWIAAVAIECDMTLATVDDAHFLRVSGLKVEH